MRQQTSGVVSRIWELMLEPAIPPSEFTPVYCFHPSPRFRTYSLAISSAKQLVALAGILMVILAGELADWSKWFVVLEEVMSLESRFLSAFPKIVAPLALITGILGYVVRSCFTFAEAWLRLRTHCYMVGQDGLYIREGFRQTHELTIRFANIQQVTLKQNPLQRLFGMADVEVQTAGGGKGGGETDSAGEARRAGHLAVFRSVDDAEGLRDRLRARLRINNQRGPAAADQTSTPHDLPDVLSAAGALLDEAQALRKSLSERLS